MAVNNGSTTITYVAMDGKKHEMSIAANKAASFAKRMINEKHWTTDVTILDDDANNKLRESMKDNTAKNHVAVTPYLIELSDHAHTVEKVSSKRLVTELERETLLAHALVSVKALGMSRDHAMAAINRVYGNPVPAPAPAPADVQESKDFLSGKPAPAPAPEVKKGGIFSGR